VPTRRELVADAAVTVLARDGLRGLTHRAVDAEAGLPGGSTSNCFRSRSALVEAVVDRLEQLDVVGIPHADGVPTVPLAELAGVLAEQVARMALPGHERTTRARLALLLEETAAPALEAGHLRLVSMVEGWLRDGGHAAPERAARDVGDLVEGALVHAVTIRSRSVDVPALTTAVERLLA